MTDRGHTTPDEVPGDEPTFDRMSDADLAELLQAIEVELYSRGWRPQRSWSKQEQA